MIKVNILIILYLTVFATAASAQVKIRLFANQSPGSAVFSVTSGEYQLYGFNGVSHDVTIGQPVLITRYNGKLAVKRRGSEGFICDSLRITGKTGNDFFSLQINGKEPARQSYSGDLLCFPDFGTLLFINICDIEKYVAGVVRAEGGSGKNMEYFKTQAVIARTYMYRYFDKHSADNYNVCDNTHCQAFNGVSSDSIIARAALETHGEIILAPDSTIIIAAFHSNCGGETSSSEDVWLTGQSYLKGVTDPYCLTSRNAKWEKSIGLNDWLEYIKKSGYTGNTSHPEVFSFKQNSRLVKYITGSFTMPLRTIRTDLNLRSTFFSVTAVGDSIVFSGRGYGHGVGLCQEGAMIMASKGFNYKKIIEFYYFGVRIADIKDAIIKPPEKGLIF